MEKRFEIILSDSFLEGKDEKEVCEYLQEKVAPAAAAFFKGQRDWEGGCGKKTVTVKDKDGTTTTTEITGCWISGK